mmetsp:Transcript_25774/g.47109  ORF Transcript_25774/g.47109 Transcript_25774/m.47109 type:complete len:160 (+) Transcript_25774:91-570(+)
MPTNPPLLPLKALHRRVSDAFREHSQEVGSGLRGCSTAKACSSLFDAEGGFGIGHRRSSPQQERPADHRSYTPPPGERPAGSRRVSFAHTPVTACVEITPYSQVYGLHPTAFEFDRAGRMQLVNAGQPMVACAPPAHAIHPHAMVPAAQGWIVPSFPAQ